MKGNCYINSNLLLKKSLLCAALFLGLFNLPTTAMQESQTEENSSILKSIVEEEYQQDYKNYHLKAITFVENDYYSPDHNGALTILKKPVPQLSELPLPFLQNAENISSWQIAITNFKNPQIMNVYPIPPEVQWPIRGGVKKYNEELLRQVLNHIEKQKADRLKELPQ